MTYYCVSKGGLMFKKTLAVVLLTALASISYAQNCTTQTLIVGGKMTVCTVCGTVVSCM